MPDQIVRPQR